MAPMQFGYQRTHGWVEPLMGNSEIMLVTSFTNASIGKSKVCVYQKWMYKVHNSNQKLFGGENITKYKISCNTSVVIYINSSDQYPVTYLLKTFIHRMEHTSKLIKNRFAQSGLIFRGQVVNPQSQTLQWQPVSRPEIPCRIRYKGIP